MNEAEAIEQLGAWKRPSPTLGEIDKMLELLADGYARGNVTANVLAVLQRADESTRRDIATKLVSLAFQAGYLNGRGFR